MRNFITLLGGNALRIAALANVTATARLPKAARPLADPIPKHVLRREYAWGGVEGLRWDRHSQW